MGSLLVSIEIIVTHQPFCFKFNVWVDLRVPALSSISTPLGQVGMIFRLDDPALNKIIMVTNQEAKLTRMKTQAHIKMPSHFIDSSESILTPLLNISLLPKINPTRLSTDRKYMARKSYHSKMCITGADFLHQIHGCFCERSC
jgi:hypothetical protein